MAMSIRDAYALLQDLQKAGILETPRYVGASGPGGQHANKKKCGVVLVGHWTPAGGTPFTIRTSGNLKSQGASVKAALTELKARHRREIQRQRQPARKTTGAMAQKYVRTYAGEGKGMVVRDHASGLEMGWNEIVEKNNLAPMIEARREAMIRDDA